MLIDFVHVMSTYNTTSINCALMYFWKFLICCRLHSACFLPIVLMTSIAHEQFLWLLFYYKFCYHYIYFHKWLTMRYAYWEYSRMPSHESSFGSLIFTALLDRYISVCYNGFVVLKSSCGVETFKVLVYYENFMDVWRILPIFKLKKYLISFLKLNFFFSRNLWEIITGSTKVNMPKS